MNFQKKTETEHNKIQQDTSFIATPCKGLASNI